MAKTLFDFKRPLRRLSNFATSVLLVVLAGCGGGGGSASPGDSVSSAPPPSQQGSVAAAAAARAVTLNGAAVASNIAHGSVSVYLIVEGAKAALPAATGSTDANGQYTVNIPNCADPCAYLVEVTGGSYIDEATGQTSTVDAATPIRAVGTLEAGATSATISPTPLTEVSTCIAEADGDLDASDIHAANTQVGQLFLGVDSSNAEQTLLTTMPAVATNAGATNATETERMYGLMLAAVSALDDLPDALTALATDIADGNLDQQAAPLKTSLQTFLASDMNNTGLVSAEVLENTLTAAAVGTSESVADSSENDITAIYPTPVPLTVNISQADKTVTVVMPAGTDVTALNPTLVLSFGATVSLSTPQDFTNPVTYTVTAQNGATQDWTVSITAHVAGTDSPQKAILGMTHNVLTGVIINATQHVITGEVTSGGLATLDTVEDLTTLFELSAGASIAANSGSYASGQVTYTVTAADESTQQWTVRLTEQGLHAQPTFSIADGTYHELQANAADFTLTTEGGHSAITTEFSSSDANVATISTSGVVTLQGAGTVILTARKPAATVDGVAFQAALAQAALAVTKADQAALQYNNVAQNLSTGTYQTEPAQSGSGTGALSFTSSDSSIVSVNDSGLLAFQKAGTVTITVTKAADAKYQQASTTFTVTVSAEKAAQTGFSAGDDVSKTFGEGTFTQAATGGSGDGAVTYQSDTEAVATVNATSGEVTIKGAGTATITATKAGDESFLEAQDSYQLTVAKANQSGFSAGNNREAVFAEGASYTQAATGGQSTGAVSYESNNTDVATVAAGGVVTLKGAGSATITATKTGDINFNLISSSYVLTVTALPDQSFSGTVSNNRVANATLTLCPINNGAKETDACQTLANASADNGSYAITLENFAAEAVWAEATGGSYTDEATGIVNTLSDPLIAVSVLDDTFSYTLHITPFTHMAALKMGSDLSNSNIVAANAAITTAFFGADATLDILTTEPVDVTDADNPATPGDVADYGLGLGMLSQLRENRSLAGITETLAEMLQTLVDDLNDDGEFTNANREALGTAVNQFIVSPRNASGLVSDDTVLDAVHQGDTPAVAPTVFAQNEITLTISVGAGGLGQGATIATQQVGNHAESTPLYIIDSTAGSDVFVIDAGTGEVTLSSTVTEVGTYTAQVTAANAAGGQGYGVSLVVDARPVAQDAEAKVNQSLASGCCLFGECGDPALESKLNGTLTAIGGEGQLSFNLQTQPSKGTISDFDPNTGNYIYTPNSDVCESVPNGQKCTDSFAYRVVDENGNEDTAVVTIVINRRPVAAASQIAVKQDEPFSGVAQAFDPDGDSLTFIVSDAPQNGQISFGDAGGEFDYLDEVGSLNDDIFVFNAIDDSGLSASAAVKVTINRRPVVVTAQDIAADFDGEQSTRIALQAHDIDRPITYQLAQEPEFGSVSISSRRYTYTPFGPQTGIDHFVIQAVDATGLSSDPVSVDVYYNPEVKDSQVVVEQNILSNVPLTAVGGEGLQYFLIQASSSVLGTSLVSDHDKAMASYIPPNIDFTGKEFLSFEVINRFGATSQLQGVVEIDVTPRVPGIEPVTNLDDIVHIKNVEDIDSLRQRAREIIFGSAELPSRQPDQVEQNITDSRYAEINNLASVDRLHVEMASGIDSVIDLFHPIEGNNELIVYHQGHGGDFFTVPPGRSAINKFVEQGYRVMAVAMPLVGMNSTGSDTSSDHNKLADEVNPLHFFFEPIAVGLNHVDVFHIPQNIYMVGLSGGGWTTHLYAGIDTRIRKSFPVAAFYPFYIRDFLGIDCNHFENCARNLLFNEVSYLDFAILASVGTNDNARREMVIHNEFDSCCSSGRYSDSYRDWVQERIDSLAVSFVGGQFDVALDATHNSHIISESALALILQELSNTLPSPVDDHFIVEKNTVSRLDVLTGSGVDFDDDGDALKIVEVSTSSQLAAIVIDRNGTPDIYMDDTVEYEPPEGFTGIDTFSYTVSDGRDAVSATVTVTVQ